MPDGEEEERGGLRHVLVTQELEALEDVPGGENIKHYHLILLKGAVSRISIKVKISRR